jgi:hypothetical protein
VGRGLADAFSERAEFVLAGAFEPAVSPSLRKTILWNAGLTAASEFG